MNTAADNQLVYVKSYFASSIEAAMEEARLEMGADALLLETREAPPEARHLGACEAVFGVRSMPKIAQPGNSGITADPLTELRAQIEELQRLVVRGLPSRRNSTTLADVLSELGVEPALADEIDHSVQRRLGCKGVVEIGRARRLSSFDPELIVRETVGEIGDRFAVQPELTGKVALVGPAGAGKTTTLVKLAVNYGLMRQRQVCIISADNYRVGAADQMRTYATILGAQFIWAETIRTLAQAIDSAPAQALILIDTPGHSSASLSESGQDLASFLHERQDVDTHLVLTASTRYQDMRRTVDAFQICRPGKLLFTHLDETSSTAAIFCEAARTGLPLSFFSGGPSIPEDIEAADKNRITAGLARELPYLLRAVA